MSDESPPGLRAKGPSHDQRTCRFLAKNPDLDRDAMPEGVDRTRLPLFLCLAKVRPVLSTMVKCKFCRENSLLYQARDDSPYLPKVPMTVTRR